MSASCTIATGHSLQQKLGHYIFQSKHRVTGIHAANIFSVNGTREIKGHRTPGKMRVDCGEGSNAPALSKILFLTHAGKRPEDKE